MSGDEFGGLFVILLFSGFSIFCHISFCGVIIQWKWIQQEWFLLSIYGGSLT